MRSVTRSHARPVAWTVKQFQYPAQDTLVGVARVKSHGEIAKKGLIKYVYDDDNSIKFPSGDYSKSETVCAPKSSETKEGAATPKIIGSQKQDHWILGKKNKQLISTHVTPRKALFTPNGAKQCAIDPDSDQPRTYHSDG